MRWGLFYAVFSPSALPRFNSHEIHAHVCYNCIYQIHLELCKFGPVVREKCWSVPKISWRPLEIHHLINLDNLVDDGPCYTIKFFFTSSFKDDAFWGNGYEYVLGRTILYSTSFKWIIWLATIIKRLKYVNIYDHDLFQTFHFDSL